MDLEEFNHKAKEIFENKVVPQIIKAKMKQTAVEWLEEKMQDWGDLPSMRETILKLAKEKEKEQIIKASAIAYEDMFGSDGTEYGKEYYNKTFKSE